MNRTVTYIVYNTNENSIDFLDFLVIDSVLVKEEAIDLPNIICGVYRGIKDFSYAKVNRIDINQRVFNIRQGDGLDKVIYNYYINKAKGGKNDDRN